MAEIYNTQPKLHRSGITAADSADPADTSGAIDTKGYEKCRFDVTLSGTGFTSLEVQALFWNPRQETWFSGGLRTFTAAGKHALMVDCRGAIVFLKVTAFSGTSFSLSIDYVLS